MDRDAGEKVLTVVIWLLLAPAGLVTVMLPVGVRESGEVVTVLMAILLAWAVREAFLKPLFLIMMMVRFHALTENQPINAQWDATLASMSETFGSLGAGFIPPAGTRGFWPGRA